MKAPLWFATAGLFFFSTPPAPGPWTPLANASLPPTLQTLDRFAPPINAPGTLHNGHRTARNGLVL